MAFGPVLFRFENPRERPPLQLILPSVADVSRYAPPPEPEDDFLTHDDTGRAVVRKPVGVKEL